MIRTWLVPILTATIALDGDIACNVLERNRVEDSRYETRPALDVLNRDDDYENKECILFAALAETKISYSPIEAIVV